VGAVEQCQPELAFHRRDLLADGRLHDVQALGLRAEMLEFGGEDEVAQLPDLHRHPF